jgi:protein SCO1
MNGRSAVRALIGALLALPVIAVAVTWLGRERIAQATTVQQLPELGAVSDFTLVESSGKPIQLADLHGKVWIASFIFTHCAGSCPIMTHHLAKLQSELPARDDLRIVSVSVDPERDTPEVLAKYATSNGADRTRWLFLTGDKELIYKLAHEAFRLAVDDTAGTREEPILHSTKLVLVDRNGVVRGYYDGTDIETQKQLVRDVNRLLALRS